MTHSLFAHSPPPTALGPSPSTQPRLAAWVVAVEAALQDVSRVTRGEQLDQVRAAQLLAAVEIARKKCEQID